MSDNAVPVVPQGVAFASLAGLPPEYGLYCAMLPTVVAALFGSSLHAVSGPTNAVSLMVFAVLVPLATPGSPEYVRLALTLSLDDLVISSFTSGPGATTLPMKIYSQVRLGVTPEVNAVSTLLIAMVGLALLAGLLMGSRGQGRAAGAPPPASGGSGSGRR